MQERGLLVKKGQNSYDDDDEDERRDRVKEKESKDIEMKSICRVIPEAEIKRMNAEDKNDIHWEFQDYLFSGIELEDDVSLGQRGFNRNLNGLCAQLINFYQKAWP